MTETDPQQPAPESADHGDESAERGSEGAERDAQAEDPTSPLRGFEDPEDAEGQPGHSEGG